MGSPESLEFVELRIHRWETNRSPIALRHSTEGWSPASSKDNLAQLPQGGRELIEGTFANIRRGIRPGQPLVDNL